MGYCAIIIEDVLDILIVLTETNGTAIGKLYCTCTVTEFPGLLQGPVPGQDEPEANADHDGVTVIFEESIPGNPKFVTKL
jgi:hypothetical protein